MRGVVGLSVPYRRGPARPTDALAHRFGPGYYMLHFQTPGVADAELAADPRATFRRLLSATSGGAPPPLPVVEPGSGFLDFLPEPDTLPAWLTEQDLDTYVDEYRDRGFTGGLNWYRNLDRSWELTAAWHGAPITGPALYLAGEQDLVIAGVPPTRLVDSLRHTLPDLRGDHPAARLRALDPAGTAGGGQRRDHRVRRRAQLTDRGEQRRLLLTDRCGARGAAA